MGNIRTAPQAAERESAIAAFATIDHDIARALSGQIAEKHRLSFAQSFTFATMQACGEAANLPRPFAQPAGVPLVALSLDAQIAAKQFGEALESVRF